MVFATKSVFDFIDFAANKNGMKLTGGIIFGVAAIFLGYEIYELNKIKTASAFGQALKQNHQYFH